MSKDLKNQRPKKSKKKIPKKRTLSFLQKLGVGVFYFFMASLFTGFIGAFIIYYKFTDELPDVRQLKTFQPSIITQIYSDKTAG